MRLTVLGGDGGWPRVLPHTWPSLGYRISSAGRSLAYTGDTGPSDRIVGLARPNFLLDMAEGVP